MGRLKEVSREARETRTVLHRVSFVECICDNKINVLLEKHVVTAGSAWEMCGMGNVSPKCILPLVTGG